LNKSKGDVTQVLVEVAHGDAAAADQLLPVVYAELRALAASYLRDQRSDQTLQPTALVHEAYLRLIDQTRSAWNDRAHFFAVAATAMRQILTDHARRRAAEKRGGGRARVSLQAADFTPIAQESAVDLERLDEVLTQLQELDDRKYRVVVLRFFGGLTVDDAALVLGVSKSTVEGDWRSARAWMSVQMSEVEE
jgi:RNA polymerase sigma factor (TIGR02999 family)